MKYIISFFKKIILSFMTLYGYNLIAAGFNLVIPINIFTLLLVTFFGIPMLFSLIFIYVLVF